MPTKTPRRSPRPAAGVTAAGGAGAGATAAHGTATVRPARPGVPPSGRAGNRRRADARPTPSFWQAWGPLIAFGALGLAAVAAIVANPGLVHDRLVKPTPVPIDDLGGMVVPADLPPPGSETQAQAQAPAGRPIVPTPAPIMAPVQPTGSGAPFPARFAVPEGQRQFPQLQLPDPGAPLASQSDAMNLLNQSRAAIGTLGTARERLYGRYLDPQTYEYLAVEDYTFHFRAPNTRYRDGTYTVKFENTTDQTRPVAMDVGADYYKPEPDGRWLKIPSRNAYAWPGIHWPFGQVFNASVIGDDVIDGRSYRVVEYDQLGTEDVGAVGFRYRNRVWIDATTYLPLKLEKVSFIQKSATGSLETTYRQLFQQWSVFDRFNEPVEIPDPGAQ